MPARLGIVPAAILLAAALFAVSVPATEKTSPVKAPGRREDGRRA